MNARCVVDMIAFNRGWSVVKAEHFDNVPPLKGPCLHCGHDMFKESHKSWFCDRESGGCGVVAHFVNPFG